MPGLAELEAEIASQPAVWRQAAALAGAMAPALPAPGERVAVTGCGTSYYIAQAYAARREAAGAGETDAFSASAFPVGRRYDRVVAISRSGTTTEVLRLLAALRGRVRTACLTGSPESPVAGLGSEIVGLDFADEQSVVQTRFATAAMVLLRAALGEDLGPALADGDRAVSASLPGGLISRRQFTFLGRGWTTGLASEAALKLREAALAWSEAYDAMEYRHGPMSVTDQSSVVWLLGSGGQGDAAAELAAVGELAAGFGAMVVQSALDPLADLIRVHRLAVQLATSRGIDPARPRHLSRSVLLGGPG